jgi:hypothetical protein
MPIATGKEGFTKIAGVTQGQPLPVFPKLPDCLKRGKSEDDLKQIEEYEFQVDEFFKRQAMRGR